MCPIDPKSIAPSKSQFPIVIQFQESRLELIPIHLQLNRLDFAPNIGHGLQFNLIQFAGGLGGKLDLAAFKIWEYRTMHFTVRLLILQVVRESHRGHGQFHIWAGHRPNRHGALSVPHAQGQLQFLSAARNLIAHITIIHGGCLAFFPARKHGLRGIRKQGLESVRQIGLHIQFGPQKIIRTGGRSTRGFPLPFQHLPKRLLTSRISKCVFGLEGKLFSTRHIKYTIHIFPTVHAKTTFLHKGVAFLAGHSPTLERIPAGVRGVIDGEK